MADPTSLHFRRLHELFFRGDDDDDHHYDNNTPREESSSAAATLVPKTTRLRINQLTLERIHQSPNIYRIENFLSLAELSHLLKLIAAKPKFERSFVGEDSHIDTEQRTSSFLSLSKQHDKIISNIETKAAELLGCFSTTTVEPLQLVRYTPGQLFGVHHDLGDYDDETNTVLLPPKSCYCRRRLVTIFCYLNTLGLQTLDTSMGGETEFPACGITVAPRAGMAVMFPNVTPLGQPDVQTIHAGLPPTKETKYGLNIWICES